MKSIIKISSFGLALVITFVMPILTVYTQGPLVPCDGPDCNFNSFFTLLNNVINFVFKFALALSAIMFAWAGIQLVFSGGNQSKMQQAKKILGDVALGLIFIAGAWLIIHLILTILGYQGEWFGFDA